MDNYEKWENEAMKEHGWVAHYVLDDDQAPNKTNYHTHGLQENFNHPDVQICLPLPPKFAHSIMLRIAEEIKKGNRFTSDSMYLGILANEYPIQFVAVREGGRKILRALIPDASGKYEAPYYKEQLTKLDDGEPLRPLYHDPNDIVTTDDALNFILSTIKQFQLDFHPDKLFEEYLMKGSNSRVFTPDQAHQLNSVLKRCFKVCNDADMDIYKMSSYALSLCRIKRLKSDRQKGGQRNRGPRL